MSSSSGVTTTSDGGVSSTVEPPSTTSSTSDGASTTSTTTVSGDSSTTSATGGLGGQAEVVSVEVSGDESAYTVAVGVRSPDTGCEQYANWWEVVTEDGELVYRRILTHSHVDEQPFVRSGGPVDTTAADVVIVRAHMNTSGFGTLSYRGSVEGGFEPFETAADFATELESTEPLPGRCPF